MLLTEQKVKDVQDPLAEDRISEVLSPPESWLKYFWRRFFRHRMAMIGLVTMLILTFLVVATPITARYSPTEQDLRNRFQPPSWEHWMGTDELGRDVWARTLYGGQISLLVGLMAMGVAIFIGAAIGTVSGFLGGWVDVGLMRFTDVFLSMPRLLVLILFSTFLRAGNLVLMEKLGFRPGTYPPVAIIIGIFAWMGVARLVRASTLELRKREFVDAAYALGVSRSRIILRHVLPNVASPIIVAATLGLAGAIISESGLSYLGFGVQLPTPTWGNMLRNSQTQLTIAPWTAIFPGMMIFISVIAINYIGDGLRDALDPRHVQKR